MEHNDDRRTSREADNQHGEDHRHLVLRATAGDEHATSVLLHGLDATQLRELAAVVAARADAAAASSTGPQAVCQAAVDAAAVAFSTTPEAIMGTGRATAVKTARHVAMAAARGNDLSYPEIAQYFDKHHTSVIHAVSHVEADPDLLAVATRIGEGVQQRTAARKLARDQRGAARRATAGVPPALRIVSDHTPDRVCAAAITAAADLFSTTPDAVRGTDRHRAAADARAVAMTAATANGLSNLDVAVFFDVHRTTVSDAVTRTQANPLLRTAADSVTAHAGAQLDATIGAAMPADRVKETSSAGKDRRATVARGRMAWAPSSGAAASRRAPTLGATAGLAVAR